VRGVLTFSGLEFFPPKNLKHFFHSRKTQNGWSKAELAKQLGVSRAWVTTVLRSLHE